MTPWFLFKVGYTVAVVLIVAAWVLERIEGRRQKRGERA